MNNFDITNEEVDKIFDEMIVPQIIKDISPQTDKEAFILGGQPGSGKSAFAREILKSNKNIFFINGDDLRAYHPKYYFYLKENDIEAADLTQPVCNIWIERLIGECIKLGVDFIVEGTMRKKDVPMKTAELLVKNGYKVNLSVVSTPYEVSLRSLQLRYEELKRLDQPARYTKKESHDEAYRNIEDTLFNLIESDLFDKFFVFKRKKGEFEGYVFDALEKEKVLKTFIDGRVRFVEDKEKENPIGEYKINIPLK